MTQPLSAAGRVRRAARLFGGAGVIVTIAGVLAVIAAAAAGSWILVVLGMVAMVMGTFVLLAGLGLRQAAARSADRSAGAAVDAEAAVAVAAGGAAGAVAAGGAAGAAAGRGGPTTSSEPCADERACGVECSAACALAGSVAPDVSQPAVAPSSP